MLTNTHTASQVIIARTNDVFKPWWLCLDASGGTFLNKSKRLCKITLTCWVLHNMAMKRGLRMSKVIYNSIILSPHFWGCSSAMNLYLGTRFASVFFNMIPSSFFDKSSIISYHFYITRAADMGFSITNANYFSKKKINYWPTSNFISVLSVLCRSD